MSFDCSDSEAYSLYRETRRRARKDHKCSACRSVIHRTNLYMDIAAIFDSSVSTYKRCLRCQAIHKHLRDRCCRHNSDPEAVTEHGERWPEERLDCGLAYRNEWDEDPPVEIQALAFWLPGDVV